MPHPVCRPIMPQRVWSQADISTLNLNVDGDSQARALVGTTVAHSTDRHVTLHVVTGHRLVLEIDPRYARTSELFRLDAIYHRELIAEPSVQSQTPKTLKNTTVWLAYSQLVHKSTRPQSTFPGPNHFNDLGPS